MKPTKPTLRCPSVLPVSGLQLHSIDISDLCQIQETRMFCEVVDWGRNGKIGLESGEEWGV